MKFKKGHKPANKGRQITPKQLANAYKKHRSLKNAWKALEGTSWHHILAVYKLAVERGLMPVLRLGAKTNEELKNPATIVATPKGDIKGVPEKQLALPKKGHIRRYFFTSAQNNTDIFMPFWNNLKVMADFYNAEIHISRFVYHTQSMASIFDKTQAFERLKTKEKNAVSWDAAFDQYLSDVRLEIAPGLVWCGEMNILPTAVDPLSGMESYTGRRSGVFPHNKLAMRSIPSEKHEATKFNYTTGAVTKRNYIQRKAGLKASFHHCYGALLVEVDSDGRWFCRQINADSEGVIHDLDVKVDANGKLTTGNFVDGISWADIHENEMVPWVRDVCWGRNGMVDTLHPAHQFFHDVLGFRSKSHHDMKSPHMQFRKWLLGQTDVRKEAEATAQFLRYAIRPWCANVVVDSNHHDHLGRWLEEQDARYDPKNVEFWTVMQTHVFKDLRNGAETPNYFRLMIDEVDPTLTPRLKVLNRDESYIICKDSNGGIECGIHGHNGPNGGKGSPQAFARMGRKANLGHYHAAGILDGIYWGGTCGKLDPDWTKGPGAWSHTHVITYPNGKRTLVTMWDGKWRA